jgi:hypothetical protein
VVCRSLFVMSTARLLGMKAATCTKCCQIQRDVVFGKELRDKEAAMRLTDAEREQMMVEMAMRQGRTGISRLQAVLLVFKLATLKRMRVPQYYSTVEQFRPRYAEGGLANAAQNLAARRSLW